MIEPCADVDNLDALPSFDMARFNGSASHRAGIAVNVQDLATWQHEAAAIAASERRILWHQPSRHEEPAIPVDDTDEVFVGVRALQERAPLADNERAILGGRERGLVLHKLIEEVLTGESTEDGAALRARARELLGQLGLPDVQDPALGPCSDEMVDALRRALQLPEIVALRPRLLPELRVYAASVADRIVTLTAGIADAVAIDEMGRIEDDRGEYGSPLRGERGSPQRRTWFAQYVSRSVRRKTSVITDRCGMNRSC